jgi:hypothetical protein
VIAADVRAAFGRANRPVPPRTRLLLNATLLALAIGIPLVWTNENFAVYDEPGNLMDPFTDATTYLAAGERLNAGHDLYRLAPGDRPVLTIPGLYSSPLLSPPPIAVLWRPLAAIDWGFAAWVAAAWVALLGTVIYLCVRTGLWGILAAIVLSHAIGEQLAVANANAFMPALYVLTWRFRDHPWIGGAIAAAASIKLAPLAMAGWLVGTGRWRALVFMLVAGGVIGLVAILGAGAASFSEYLGTLRGTAATDLSLSGMSGLPWASYVVLVGGFGLSIVLGRRGYPTASWSVALVASVVGTPALYASGLVSLLALTAPLLGTGRALKWNVGRAERRPAGTPAAEAA